MQPPLKAPFPKPDNREQFWSDFENKSFEYVAKKYGGIGLKNDAKSLFRKIKRKIVWVKSQDAFHGREVNSHQIYYLYHL